MRKLMEYLPEKYENSRETVAFQEAIQPEATKLWEARNEFLRQLSPKTAEGWGLALWEQAFGIKPPSDAGIEQRRSRVVAKIRGVGTVTAEMLKDVVESYMVHDVEIRERPRDNWVDVLFSTAGVIPQPNLQSMLEALWEIFPAHLGLTIGAEAAKVETDVLYVPDTSVFTTSPLPDWRMDYSLSTGRGYVASTTSISETPLPAWRMDYSVQGAVRFGISTAAFSETRLPEWRGGFEMQADLHIGGSFGSVSTTILPPFEKG